MNLRNGWLQRSLPGVALLLLLLSGGGAARAEWMTVEGRAVIYKGEIAAARELARKDALEQVSLSAGARLTATDEMQNGQLVNSRVSLQPEFKIGRVVQVAEKVVQEKVGQSRQGKKSEVTETVTEELLSMTFRIQLLPQPVCPQTGASRYQKKVVFTRFAPDRSDQADLGGLYDADEQLPEGLIALLGSSRYLDALNGTQLSLYENVSTAPTFETDARTMTQATGLARTLGAQFVVAGMIRSLAPADRGAYSTSPWGRLLRTAGQADLSREFIADMYIYDGFSGALLFQKRYRTTGEWDVDLHTGLPINSVGFAQTDYGAAVLGELAGMAADVEVQVACQPFITRIRKVEDKTVMFESGATQGLQPGDVLQVYRTRQLFEGTRYQGTELKDVKLALQVNQVQPELSFGDLAVDPTRFNIQTDDLLIVW